MTFVESLSVLVGKTGKGGQWGVEILPIFEIAAFEYAFTFDCMKS